MDGGEQTLVWHIDKNDHARLIVSDSRGRVSELTRVSAVPASAMCQPVELVRQFVGLEHPPSYYSNFADDGALLWYTDYFDEEWSINPDTGEPGTSLQLRGLIQDSYGQNFWTIYNDDVELRDRNNVRQYKIDTEDDFNAQATHLAFDEANKILYVAGKDYITRNSILLTFNVALDPAVLTGRVPFVEPVELAFSDGMLWMLSWDGSIEQLDPKTLRTVNTYKVEQLTKRYAYWTAMALRGNRLFLSDIDTFVDYSLLEYRIPSGP
jgi:hypothetical protein